MTTERAGGSPAEAGSPGEPHNEGGVGYAPDSLLKVEATASVASATPASLAEREAGAPARSADRRGLILIDEVTGQYVQMDDTILPTFEDAIQTMPLIDALLARLVRYNGMLRAMIQAGLEGRKATTWFEPMTEGTYKLEQDEPWAPVTSWQELRNAMAPLVGEQLSIDELNRAVRVVVPVATYVADNRVLNELVKRGGDLGMLIEAGRKRVPGAKKLTYVAPKNRKRETNDDANGRTDTG